ncbi:Matrix metalloproteinase-19 [Dissostichus eleginoides]|uniref:Matrix metalloproteinase-19 n=1 Tax=Dissostichus eleginoides TaxID=100907 RepID=A0AAD9CC69_DISEL|nr:Matrix metalloproteinase-19 [Dissostichus eleginoides]
MGNMEFLLELMVLLVLMTTAASGRRADDFTGAVVYLKKYAYLNAPLPSEGRRPPPQEMKAALRVFQKATQLQVSGRVDAATLRMMRKPRCGEEDSFRFHRYRVLGHWRKKMLTYRILNFTPDLGQGKTRQAISAAFRYWSDVSPLKFRETQTGRADIKISFHRKDKSCPVPFDGRGQVLAHADAPESGTVHFDSDEVWTEGKSSGEAGEAPSSQKESFGSGSRSGPLRFSCGCCDVGPPAEDLCVQGEFLWTVSSSGLDPPRLTSDLWRELPGGLSAAVTSQRSGKTYFLKENRVWRYSGFKLDHGFPRKLSNIPANIDAAFYLSKSKTLIFIKGSGYWQWDETSTSGFSSYPRPLSLLFPGAPGAPDAALASSDGNILLFKGSQVWSVKLQKHVEKPRSLAADWLKCDD